MWNSKDFAPIPFYLLACLFIAGGANGQSEPDKSGYHLFNPVPADLLRDMEGDRPDGTESPTTVDAGHIQLEMSFIDLGRDRSGGSEFESVTAAATNVRVGLLKDLELQIIFDVYNRQESEIPGLGKETVEGFGDITLRPKWNLWGNDGGRTAFALMPAIKIPTGTELSNGEVEGGIVAPLGIDLTDRIGLGLMAEVDWVYDEGADEYETELFHTAVLGFDLTDEVGVYVEYIGIAGPDAYQPFVSGGITWGLTENVQLDAGAVFGLNEHAQDVQVFSGITVRF